MNPLIRSLFLLLFAIASANSQAVLLKLTSDIYNNSCHHLDIGLPTRDCGPYDLNGIDVGTLEIDWDHEALPYATYEDTTLPSGAAYLMIYRNVINNVNLNLGTKQVSYSQGLTERNSNLHAYDSNDHNFHENPYDDIHIKEVGFSDNIHYRFTMNLFFSKSTTIDDGFNLNNIQNDWRIGFWYLNIVNYDLDLRSTIIGTITDVAITPIDEPHYLFGFVLTLLILLRYRAFSNCRTLVNKE
ncbi:hypothetical protein [Aliiglaciecola litoralis]|uniref:PEP-CTERM protein-sorting domain-containing protein n=1 Tax=Aliiglaciecola litoralis TaxID=582857 RepID=A0ABN1LQ11_9ALTE